MVFDKLSLKQQRFVEAYLRDPNAIKAYEEAGYSLSGRTGQANAYRLLEKTNIRAAILERRKEVSEKVTVDAAWLLDRLAQESKADVRDLYDEQGYFKPVHDWPLIWRQGLVTEIIMGEVMTAGPLLDESGEEIRPAVFERRPVKLKLSDRVKRLELVGRHIGVQAFKDKLEVQGDLNLVEALERARKRVEG